MMIPNTMYCLLAIVLVANTTLSEESEREDRSDLETYIWLEREGIPDPEVPNSKVHQLLSEGLKHEDPEIVMCSISAITFYIGITSEFRVNGKQYHIDRKLREIPGLYDRLIEIWEQGWEAAQGVVPPLTEKNLPADLEDRMVNKTGCLLGDDLNMAWLSLPQSLAYLFPQDDKVYEIIWKQLPQYGPGSLLAGLFEGKFNHPKDEQFRIDMLTNPETELYWSRLAARSLGDFRTERSLDTLVQVLKDNNMKYSTPMFVILEAMLKHEAEAVPYIDLMEKTLKNRVPPAGNIYKELRITLIERLKHFKEKYAEEVELPSP